jgi:internalin A
VGIKKDRSSDDAYAEALRRIERAAQSRAPVLNLTGLGLSAIPPEIGQLTALTELYVFDNQLTVLPPEIGQLTALTTLYVSNNQLTALPPEIGQLTALTMLYVSGNQLTTLPASLRRLTKLSALFLHGNPALGLPAEVLGPTWQDVRGGKRKARPPAEILDYYFSHRQAALAEGTEPLMEAKVLVLGEASVGKSCLIAALSEGKRRRELDDKGTSGIVRKFWPVPVSGNALAANPKSRGVEMLRLNLWDFGGQEIYHSAHTLFLTRRAIYLIVLSKRDNDRQNNVDYWLRMAASFGGPDAVTYVVVNKCDLKVGHPPDEQALRRKYPQLRGFLHTSCDDLTGIAQAREVIVREALGLEGVRLPIAKSWLATKKSLEKMPDHTLSMQQWSALCCEKRVSKNEKLGNLRLASPKRGFASHPRWHAHRHHTRAAPLPRSPVPTCALPARGQSPPYPLSRAMNALTSSKSTLPSPLQSAWSHSQAG